MNTEKFKKALYALVKNDYGFEVYNASENLFRFSFYNLNSCYNAFCTMTRLDTEHKWIGPYIDWQYANENKKMSNEAKIVVAFAVEYFEKYGNYEFVKNEISYFEELSDIIFNAKYSLSVQNHVFS